MGPNRQQSEAWNGPESVHYVDHADRYDRQLAPITRALLDVAAVGLDDVVLDVGCGCGVTTLAAAGTARRAVGVDISDPLTQVAAGRALAASIGNAEFVVADAQVHDFGEAAFDVVISQFGLMFFDDAVDAFTNLHRAIAPGGRIVFTAWQRLGDNEWLAPVVRAVAEHTEVPDLGGLASGGGMFGLEDDVEIASLLDRVGFRDVSVAPIAPVLVVGGGGSLEESTRFLLGMGIVRGLLGRLDDEQHGVAVDRIRAELRDRYEPGVGVRSAAAVWMVSANA